MWVTGVWSHVQLQRLQHDWHGLPAAPPGDCSTARGLQHSSRTERCSSSVNTHLLQSTLAAMRLQRGQAKAAVRANQAAAWGSPGQLHSS